VERVLLEGEGAVAAEERSLAAALVGPSGVSPSACLNVPTRRRRRRKTLQRRVRLLRRKNLWPLLVAANPFARFKEWSIS
jgi:hypothetical protein